VKERTLPADAARYLIIPVPAISFGAGARTNRRRPLITSEIPAGFVALVPGEPLERGVDVFDAAVSISDDHRVGALGDGA